MSSKNDVDDVHKSTTLRPLKIIKKRSAPLDQALDEINKSSVVPTVSTSSTLPKDSVKVTTTSNPATARRRSATKEKEKKRERWLLTRKTWKYMTDAGRKLIPEGAQNRKDDIPKVEAYFNQICAAEPRFILWKRKASYPGAFRNSKRRFRQLLQHTCQKQNTLLKEREEENNVNEVINLLQTHLNLHESYKTTTLLGTKTVRPDKTHSPSAHRPSAGNSCLSSNLVSETSKDSNQLVENDQLLARLRALTHSSTYTINLSNESITPDILKNKAALKQVYYMLKKQHLHRLLSKHSNTENINEFKAKIKKSTSLSSLQQFNECLTNNSSKPHKTESSTQNVNNIKYNNEFSKTTNKSFALSRILKNPSDDRKSNEPILIQPKTSDSTFTSQAQTPSGTSQNFRKKTHFNTFGTQTNFIQLQEIKCLAEEYKARKREEASLLLSNTCLDDGSEKTESEGINIRRKSSVDNEDISQSVSDTIKRYLRMARKKSIHDDQVNRFKRVNYDRNLRNIKAKGEINPPGMDEDNSKAVQTLDAWALIALEFIRGNENSSLLDVAHSDWQKSLEERIRKKNEYDQKILGNSENTVDANCSNSYNNEKDGVHKQSFSTSRSSSSGLASPTSSTSPTSSFSPTNDKPRSEFGHTASNIIQSGSNFLSNLWHGTTMHGLDHQKQYDETSQYNKVNSNIKEAHIDPATRLLQSVDASNCEGIMQKSKSSTNVGQFVSKKLLKSRSRSQTRSAVHLPTTYNHKWAPSEKFAWTSENGDRICILDSVLRNLSAIESKYLQQVALQKINELNIGLDIGPGSYNGNGGKIQKRHALQKKKALTTNLFDIGKKEDSLLQTGIFGNNLNTCVANDRKRSKNFCIALEGESATLSRCGGDDNSNKLNPNVRSCENLPSSTLSVTNTSGENCKGLKSGSKIGTNYFGYLTKSALSRSQSDMRRKSQEFDKNHSLSSSTEFFVTHDLQVPTFITLCIQFLEIHGLHQVGLFRVSTSKKRVMQMKEEFDKRFVTEISETTCPHDVATLLKEFLRDLSEPLLCGHLYKAFLKTQKIRNRRLQLEAISHLIKLLPETHRDTLYVLLKFLAKVATYSDDVLDKEGNVLVSGNKMDSNNLATVFAPNILKSTSLTANVTEQEVMADAINVVRIMIDHFEELFRVSAEILDTVYANILDECPEKLFELCESRLLMSKHPTNMANIVVEHTPSSRRQSTPNVLNKSEGVVSASFQIPVSLQTDLVPNKKEHLFSNVKTSTNLYSNNRKNPDIPPSEQVLCEQEVDGRRISGSSIFGSQEIHNIGGKTATFITPNMQLPQLTPAPNILSCTCNLGMKSNEPKLSTSISNIGESILRSKTEEFERKMQQNNHSTEDKFSTNSSGKNQSQQLYKRQELIASSKRNRSHKK